MDRTGATENLNISGEIDQEENLESVIGMAQGDIRKIYLVKDGTQEVGILRMESLVKSLVPIEAPDDGIRKY
jgi:glycine betaine/proline transport system ATP-binding protein